MMDVNFLPWREYSKNKKRYVEWLRMIVALIFALIICFLFDRFLSYQVRETKSRVFILQKRLEGVSERMEKVRRLYQIIEYQKVPQTDLNFVLNHQQRILFFMQKISSLLSNTMILHQMYLENNAWKIEGVTAKISDVLQYAEHLKDCFKKVDSLRVQQKEGQFYFQIKMEMIP